MARSNINHIVVSGNLTADPELRPTGSGVSVCELRLANNVPIKKEGNWDTKVNYFQVTVWGKQGENCSDYLEKGSPVVIIGRLDWQKWQDANDAKKTNSRVVIIASQVEFMSKPKKKKEEDVDLVQDNAPEDIPF